MLTIGFTVGPGGNTMAEIDWPKMLMSDGQIVNMLKDIRRAGIAATMHITKKMDGGDHLEVHTPDEIALYRRGLHVPPLSPAMFFSQMDGEYTAMMPKPEECWIFVASEGVGKVQQPEEYARLASKLSQHIPDIRKFVKSPCGCKGMSGSQIWSLIQHLNDHHHPDRKVNGRRIKDVWTRERIADWLDEVDADLVFDPDLPAKRAAQRARARAAQRELVENGYLTKDLLLKKIQDDLIAVEPKISAMKAEVVKLDVAITEFATSMHETLSKIAKCTCPACAPKEES